MFRINWNSIRKMLFLYLFFLIKNLQFEKYKRSIQEPSSPDLGAVLEKKFWDMFSRVLYAFLKKSQPKKWNFDQNWINFTRKDKNGKQTEQVTLVWESMLKFFLCLSNKLYIRLYCFILSKTVPDSCTSSISNILKSF